MWLCVQLFAVVHGSTWVGSTFVTCSLRILFDGNLNCEMLDLQRRVPQGDTPFVLARSWRRRGGQGIFDNRKAVRGLSGDDSGESGCDAGSPRLRSRFCRRVGAGTPAPPALQSVALEGVRGPVDGGAGGEENVRRRI